MDRSVLSIQSSPPIIFNPQLFMVCVLNFVTGNFRDIKLAGFVYLGGLGALYLDR